MGLQIGDTLIALNDNWMEDGEEQCLTKDKEYAITNVSSSSIFITSDIEENHEWEKNILDEYFKQFK